MGIKWIIMRLLKCVFCILRGGKSSSRKGGAE